MGGAVAIFGRMRRVIERAIRLAAVAAAAVILPLMLITTADVLGRDFFGTPVSGTYELSEYMLAAAVLLGAAYTQQTRGHVAATFVVGRFGPRARAFCQAFTLALCLVVVGALAWQGVAGAIDETGVTDQLRIPRAPFKMLVGVGAGLLWCQMLFDFLDAVAALGRRRA
jgi:TRAP-type C4-dicarboxylate transport system permease small subunit